jgi:hypothetical protein
VATCRVTFGEMSLLDHVERFIEDGRVPAE